MATAIQSSFYQQCDANGVPIRSGSVKVCAAGLTTPLAVFSDAALSVPASNPVNLDSAGRHDMRYIAVAAYKLIFYAGQDGTGGVLYTRDHIDPGVPLGSGALAIANGGTGATTAEQALVNLGAATTAELSKLSYELSQLAGNLGGVEATRIATGGTSQRPEAPLLGQIRFNTSLGDAGQIEAYDALDHWSPVGYAQPIAAGFKNLIIKNNSGTPNSQVDIDADAVTVETTTGFAYRLTGIDLTVNCAGTGANGLDSGSLANSTWYAVYVIYNPTTQTVAGLVSSNGSNPTMPSDYTAKARLGWFRTNGSAQFHRIIQRGRRAQYIVSASVTTTLPLMDSGSKSAWTSITLSNFVPTTASAIHVSLANRYNAGSYSNVVVAPNSNYGTSISTGTNQPYGFGDAGDIFSAAINFWLGIETTSIQWGSDASGGAISCIGWEDNI